MFDVFTLIIPEAVKGRTVWLWSVEFRTAGRSLPPRLTRLVEGMTATLPEAQAQMMAAYRDMLATVENMGFGVA